MKNLKVILISIISIICVIILGIFAINGVQNKAINLEEQVKTASSDIKVQRKKVRLKEKPTIQEMLQYQDVLQRIWIKTSCLFLQRETKVLHLKKT